MKPFTRVLYLIVLNSIVVLVLGNSLLLAADRGSLVREAVLYLSPDTASSKLAQVERGRELILLERGQGWLHVEAMVGSDKSRDPAFVLPAHSFLRSALDEMAPDILAQLVAAQNTANVSPPPGSPWKKSMPRIPRRRDKKMWREFALPPLPGTHVSIIALACVWYFEKAWPALELSVDEISGIGRRRLC